MIRLRKHLAYQSIDTLTIYRFIKIVLTKDLNHLVIYGQPKNLSEIWEDISQQYNEASSEDATNQYLLDCIKDISYLQNKLFIIETCCNELLKNYNSDLCEVLNELGFDFDYTNDDNLYRKLELTISQAKTFLIDLEQRKIELTGMQGVNKPLTNGEFEIQVAMYNFKGANISSTTTVSEFIGIQKAYKLINTPNE